MKSFCCVGKVQNTVTFPWWLRLPKWSLSQWGSWWSSCNAAERFWWSFIGYQSQVFSYAVFRSRHGSVTFHATLQIAKRVDGSGPLAGHSSFQGFQWATKSYAKRSTWHGTETASTENHMFGASRESPSWPKATLQRGSVTRYKAISFWSTYLSYKSAKAALLYAQLVSFIIDGFLTVWKLLIGKS